MIDVDLDQHSIPLVWQELFRREGAVDVEIGSGKGKFLLELAASRPERAFLAVERAGKYHDLCCTRAARRGLENVRLLRTTAEDLLFRLLPPESVNTLYVLFPDPWPKKRHHKRRLFKPEVVSAMASVLGRGGRLLVKSDHVDYAAVIRRALDGEAELRAIDAETAFEGLPSTGFEHKYRVEGRTVFAFAIEKK
jgi:tRNA (guanine-N7-)-methyltransferase